MSSQNFIVTDPETGISAAIEAENAQEAIKKMKSRQKKAKKNESTSESEPEIEVTDLNGDGKFDSEDASLAGEALNQAKSIN